jgi:hypothetical protein
VQARNERDHESDGAHGTLDQMGAEKWRPGPVP